MMRLYTFVISSVFLLLVSCEKKQKNIDTKAYANAEVSANDSVQEQSGKSESVVQDSIFAKSIYIQKTENGFTRLWVNEEEDHNSKYFFSNESIIVKAGEYSYKSNIPVLKKEVELYNLDWHYLSIDSASVTKRIIQNKNYLFFTAEVNPQGKAIPSNLVEFWAINLNNINEKETLQYSGMYSAFSQDVIKGKFTNDWDFSKLDGIKKELYNYANNSKLIYHQKAGEESISHYKNYEEKWEDDNGVANDYGAGYGGPPDTIYSTYYKSKLFEDLNDVNNSTIENENFKMHTSFRGNLLGYDKKRKLYFPVIVESCAHFCNKDIEFLNENLLQITYEDKKSFKIDLKAIIFNK